MAARAASSDASLRTMREEDHVPGSRSCKRLHADLGREARLDERLVESARRLVGEPLGRELQRHEVRVRAGRHVIRGHEDLDVADAAHGDLALAVLHRLDRCRSSASSRVGLRDRAEVFARSASSALALVELAGDDEHGVVGLIVLLVERLQALDRHALDVAAAADRRLAVVVPADRRRSACARSSTPSGCSRRDSNSLRTTVNSRVEVLLRDERVDHPVGFEVERPLEVLVAGVERLEVVRAVPRRACR